MSPTTVCLTDSTLAAITWPFGALRDTAMSPLFEMKGVIPGCSATKEMTSLKDTYPIELGVVATA